MRCIAANIQQFSGNERSARCEIWSSEIPTTQRWTLNRKGLPSHVYILFFFYHHTGSMHRIETGTQPSFTTTSWGPGRFRLCAHVCIFGIHSRHMIRPTYTVFIEAVWNKPLLGKGHSRSISPRRRSTSLGHQNED